MAIQTVNTDNLAAFAASREAKGSKLTSAADVTEASQRIAAAKESPVIRSVEEKVEGIPDPGSQEPTAKALADKAKAGTDPGVQKRFDELTKARKEAEELFETEYTEKLSERAKREAAEKRVQELEAAAKPKVEELKEPDANDPKYKTVAEYLKDRAQYDAQVMDRKIAEAREEERNRIAMEQANAVLAAKAVQVRKDFPDFDDVISEAVKEKLDPPAAIQAALRESDVGLHIAYHLAKNLEDRERIFALPAWKALREIGKLEDQYLKAPENVPPKPIETTKAPAPVAKLNGSDGSVPTDISKETDFLKYKDARREQLRKRRH